jgi:invasion protein IalB
VIASVPLNRAATWTAIGATAVAASLLFLDAAHAQQRQPTSPPQQQFGPRVNQAPQQQMPQPEIVATHGAWAVQCQTQPPANGEGSTDGGSAERTCGMIQSTRHEQRDTWPLTLVMVKGEQDGKEVTMMRVMAPIGVYLPTGVALEIDGDAIGRVPFTRCMPQVCIAFAEASPPTLEKMRKGAKANFIIYEAPGLGMSMELSLQGFTAALAKLNEL